MCAKNVRQIELIAVVFLYLGLHIVVLDPIVGSVTGFETPAWTSPSRRGEGVRHVLTTPRGWILLAGGVSVLLGYVFLRARLAGESVQGFWNE